MPFTRTCTDPDLRLFNRAQMALSERSIALCHMSKRPPQDHQGNPLRPSELAGLMRANAEALFQDILGKPLSSSFKNTYKLRGRKRLRHRKALTAMDPEV